jgi:tryptophanyl-tRNA synthetase
VVPEPYIGKRGARVMGLDDPTLKMSKSASSDMNYISLMDPADQIRKKIKRAVTDSGSDIKYDEKEKPAISNLLSIYSAFDDRPIEDIETLYKGKGYGDFKKDLGELLVEKLTPLQKRINDFQNGTAQLQKILSEGAERARTIARPKLMEVKKRFGLGR